MAYPLASFVSLMPSGPSSTFEREEAALRSKEGNKTKA
jgi:hypothetical protein